MASTRALPHQTDRLFLTDGGIETSLIFDDGLELPHFAAFYPLRHGSGRSALTRYFERHIAVAKTFGLGFVLESPTWRANPDWADRLGYSKAELAASNADAVELMCTLRRRHETAETPMVVSGCVGPRGDGYVVGAAMRPEAAEAYHDEQIAVLAGAGCDLVSAITMTNVPEAIGIVRATTRRGLPSVISFTVETDGRLPSGIRLEQAIADVDAATDAVPAYYMVNCAHLSHFAHELRDGRAWTHRIGGIRANASCKSHAELNEAVELDRGDPVVLADDYRALRELLPRLAVVGGCCGTSHHHLRAIASALAEAPAQ
jgi:S-methylmethionine-dependent homocysteine/selenocysteine methylase